MQHETGDVVQTKDAPSVPVTVLLSFTAKDGTESYVGIAEKEQTVQVVTAAQVLPVQDVDDVQFQA